MIRFLEISWLCLSLITAGVAIFYLVTDDLPSFIFMLSGTVIASIMYLIRRRQRIRMDEQRRKDEDGLKYH